MHAPVTPVSNIPALAESAGVLSFAVSLEVRVELVHVPSQGKRPVCRLPQWNRTESASRKCVWNVFGHEILATRTGNAGFWPLKTPARLATILDWGRLSRGNLVHHGSLST